MTGSALQPHTPQPLTWQPEALVHHPLIEHVHVAPHGRQVLYTVRAAHMTDDTSEFRDRVWIANIDGRAAPLQLTHDLGASMPKWSPDGTLIAFLRTLPASDQKGLWLMAAQGGEPWPLTPPAENLAGHEFTGCESIQKFEWRPDGRAIAFTAVPTDAERRRKSRQKDDVQQWRVDYERAHLFIVEFSGEFEPPHFESPPFEPPETVDAFQPAPPLYGRQHGRQQGQLHWRQLTSGAYHVDSLTWHPQGGALAFIAQETPYIESWPTTRLQSIQLTGSVAQSASEAPSSDRKSGNRKSDNHGQEHRLNTPTHIAPIASWKSVPAYSPDGRWIACQAGIEGNRWAYAGRMHIYPADRAGDTASPTPTRKTAAPQALADVSDAQPGLIGWTPDSRHVLVFNDQGLGTEVLALPIDGGPPQTIVTGQDPCAVAHMNEQGLLALVRQHHDKLNGVEIVDLAHSDIASDVTSDITITATAPQRIATPAVPNYPAGPLPQIQELHWQTPDGFEIEGILYLPSDYDITTGDATTTPTTTQKLPLLLHIHGGPMSVFQRAYAGVPYYYPPAALCELGFAVLRANPRGSSGYGQAFRFANIQDWGEGDYRDLMQGVDIVIEMGIADPDRLGVCGWSYGGFMTSWIITQTHRFQAASIGAPLTNPMSFSATADIPSFVPDFYGGEAWEASDFYQDHAPIFHAHKVRTPSIIQHGAADERVPLEQGLQYYHVLARNNVPAEMYIYPRQGHAILEPRLLIDAIRRNLDWFVAHLSPPGAHKMPATSRAMHPTHPITTRQI